MRLPLPAITATLATGAVAAVLALAAGPAAAQTLVPHPLAGSGGPEAARVEGEVLPAPVPPCIAFRNVVKVMIDPGVHAIPVFLRPFTSRDNIPPAQRALWAECVATPDAEPPAILWDVPPERGVMVDLLGVAASDNRSRTDVVQPVDRPGLAPRP